MLLRLQAKQESGRVLQAVNTATSKVERAAANLPRHEGTTISTAFVSKHLKSWQAHLEQISPFLLQGEGVWWHKTEHGYHFADGEDDLTSHPEGPQLYHFRSHSLDDVQDRKRKCSQEILDNKVSLPTPLIHLYDDEGNPIGTRTFNSTRSCSDLPTIHDQPSTHGSTSPSSELSTVRNQMSTHHSPRDDQPWTDSPPGPSNSTHAPIVSDQLQTGCLPGPSNSTHTLVITDLLQTGCLPGLSDSTLTPVSLTSHGQTAFLVRPIAPIPLSSLTSYGQATFLVRLVTTTPPLPMISYVQMALPFCQIVPMPLSSLICYRQTSLPVP